ncbi:hypothetical protein [Stenotrophomonas oahuensis]|uniref:Uncharacterized protein n=1 Tax=Stenotrophomonas oahuensis TaxID=3003271 RepID=A0ABY9YV66_9GAMM|nr:hypothetical protein [Stenotrophomonas sp. A5586]WNH54806.1 hypothetical protein PDM29_20900 [Stenotrophomonas sp. A5586]
MDVKKKQKLNDAVTARIGLAQNQILELQHALQLRGKPVDDGYELDDGWPVGVTLIKHEFLEWYDGFHSAVHALQDGYDQFKYEHAPDKWLNELLENVGLPAHAPDRWAPVALAIRNRKKQG